MESPKKRKKRPPAALFALGRKELPWKVEASGATYRFVKLFKHDFFAATGLYELDGEVSRAHDGSGAKERGAREGGAMPRLAVLKVQRVHPLWGFPMQWLGKRVAGHEIRIYEKLQGVAGIPEFLGRVGHTGFLHAFIPGTDLHSDLPLTKEFFCELEALFQALHERHVAYVDSNKRENILYGEDGRPWLIDFQISFHCKKGARDNIVAKMILRKFVKADWYHFYKHKTRLLPGICTEEDFAKAQRRGFLHRVHRLVARPLIVVRRKLLSRYDLAKTR